ncbi:MAG: hypothetical protein JW940_01290 [Polyangiaceae bacterium]|nr:hypothetical protein [Polyangiaceae bacterium]
MSARRALLGLRVLSASPWVRLGAFCFIALVALQPALGRAGLLNEIRDAQFLFAYDMSAVDSVLYYGQLPLWNPYYCGGIYALGAPEVSFVSPTFLLSLLLGPARALSLTAFVMTVLGMEGFFRWLRLGTGSSLGPALFAPILGLNGLFAGAYFNGWTHFYGFELVPWVLWGVRLAVCAQARGVLAAVLGLGWMIGFGGTYAPLYTVLFAGLEILFTLGFRRHVGLSLGARAGWLAVAAALSVGVSAFRLWPLLETMASAPRVMAGSPGDSLSVLAEALFSAAAPGARDLGMAGRYYFGLSVLPLVALGPGRRRRWFAVLLLALSMWAATGYAYGSGPFVWLRELSLFEKVRYPERFLFFAALYAGVLGAGGVDFLVRIARRHLLGCAGVAVALCLLAASTVQSIASYRTVLESMWLGAPPKTVEQPFAQARGNRWLASHVRALNRGTLSCYEAYSVVQSERLRGDLSHEEYLVEPAAGQVVRKSWSPNRLDLLVHLTQPTRLLVNQNYHPGWRANVGRVVSEQGLLAVELPRGEHALTLSFRPRSATGGLTTSILALAALLALCRRMSHRGGLWDRSDWKRAVLLATSPLLVVPLAWWLLPEPSLPRAKLLNPNRTPVVVPQLPEGVEPVRLRFALPVRIEGVRLPKHVDVDGVAPFELYWRVTGRVPRAVGVFVHLMPQAGNGINADHELVGASLFFRDAPRGKLLCDAFSVDMSSAPRGAWRMYVGLWHASGSGERVAIEPGASVPVSENRALVGTFEPRRSGANGP